MTALTAAEPISSTPILSEEYRNPDTNLSALESAFNVIITSETQLPELRVRTNPGQTDVNKAPSRTDDDDVSSVCDVPALPGGGPKVQFLAGQSEEETTMEETSQINPIALYGFSILLPLNPGLRAKKTTSEEQTPGSRKSSAFKSWPGLGKLPDLSGRSRAILKEYFEEASPICHPVGQSTITFSERQVYHLLRVLADETLSRSFSTMERMVIDAV